MSSTGTPQYPSYYGSAQGSRTSPAHGSIHGSRTSLNRGGSISGEVAPLDIDPGLINPAETAPAGEPRDIAPQSPDELTQFTLPGYESPNKTKKEGKGGISGTFKGGFGKVKGLFKRGPKEAPDVGVSGIEDDDEYGTGSQEYLDKIETPTGSASGGNGDKQSTMQRFQNFFKKDPEMAGPSLYQPGDVMILKDPEPDTMLTFGIEDSLYYIGPAFIGLSFFALVGKCFFTCFWKEDPVPTALKPALEFYETYLGGVKDPYAHKKYTRSNQVFTYYGPMSTVTKTEVVQMETFGYPGPAQPKMYDESIDTRLREPSPAPSSNRSFIQDPLSPVRVSLDYSAEMPVLPTTDS